MKEIVKKALSILAVLPLFIGSVNMPVRNENGINIEVSAEEGDEGGEGNEEVPGEETPTEDEPEEPVAEDPTEEPEPAEEPTEENTEPTDDDDNSETETTATEDEDDDDEDENSGNNGAGAFRVTRRTTNTKRATETTVEDETTVTTVSGISEIGADNNSNSNNNVMTTKRQAGSSSPVGGIAAILATVLAAVTAVAVVRVRIESGRKCEYYPGGEYDENNRPMDALDFNSEYGKYNASAVTNYEDRIILTFEPEYENEYTSKILDVLKEKKISAVFFLNGSCVKKQGELINRMINEGHILGNYGMTDESMPDMKPAKLREDMLKLHDYVLQKYGYEMKYFRPVYGEFSKKVLTEAKNMGYETLMWSYTYIDYETDDIPDKGTAIEDLVTAAHSGGIYLLRSVTDADAEILSDAIDVLRDEGYTF